MAPLHNRIDLIRPDAPELAAHGGWPVGVRTHRMVHAGQVDVLTGATCGRVLVVEEWFPAVAGSGEVQPYATLLRDGRTAVALHGVAARGAEAAQGAFPLVIVSHGFPGNRMLMAHLGENLASKGYRVAAIDHADSTYGDAAYLGGQAFGSTLVNRPLDTGFVIGALGAERAAIVGYSMGGYGALVSGGARVAQAAVAADWAAAFAAHWARHCAAVADPRVQAVVCFGPWGRQAGLWDAAGMAGLSVPALIIAGSADEVSGYDTGMRLIFDEAVGVERHLLTYDGAGHNAGAPIPAPWEAWQGPGFDHYADPVWDTVRMNNIAQHYVTAFLDQHLRGDDRAQYLDAPAIAPGLRWETKQRGQ